MANNKILNELSGQERLFVAIIKLIIKEKDYKFFQNGKCEYLADYLGVDIDIAGLIKKKLKNTLVKP